MTELFAYKILTRDEWNRLKAEGEFAGSVADLADGFIHLSARPQVKETVARHFAGQDDLVLAMVDIAALDGKLRWEPSRNGEDFPHLYAPLPLAAVAKTVTLRLDSSGVHQFPAGF